MKKQIYEAPKMPSANLAVNKSRIKLYNNTGDMPTYYLQSGTQFQIELFNPTTDVILAKIILNGKSISQGGLVLNPGQRVFLERYLDVAKKFLFDTYEVANTAEVKEAIVKNGDFKVEFYKESAPMFINYNQNYSRSITLGDTGTARGFGSYSSAEGIGSTTSYSSNITPTSFNASSAPTLDSLSDDFNLPVISSSTKLSSRASKSIETGRVEQGSSSEQKVVTVDKKFKYVAFHTIECKMLPISQKVNTVEDIQVKVYCTNCAHKLKKEYKFCGHCGTKA